MIYVKCNSHRAHYKLKALLGHEPRDYFTTPKFTHYLQVPAEHADAALSITGITKGKPRGHLCLAWGQEMENPVTAAFDKAGDRDGWGTPYGTGPRYLTDKGVTVWMRRKGVRVRFFDALGQQVGLEQANVAPAVAAAMVAGWRSL